MIDEQQQYLQDPLDRSVRLKARFHKYLPKWHIPKLLAILIMKQVYLMKYCQRTITLMKVTIFWIIVFTYVHKYS